MCIVFVYGRYRKLICCILVKRKETCRFGQVISRGVVVAFQLIVLSKTISLANTSNKELISFLKSKNELDAKPP